MAYCRNKPQRAPRTQRESLIVTGRCYQLRQNVEPYKKYKAYKTAHTSCEFAASSAFAAVKIASPCMFPLVCLKCLVWLTSDLTPKTLLRSPRPPRSISLKPSNLELNTCMPLLVCLKCLVWFTPNLTSKTPPRSPRLLRGPLWPKLKTQNFSSLSNWVGKKHNHRQKRHLPTLSCQFIRLPFPFALAANSFAD
jgi:hypothetical protein